MDNNNNSGVNTVLIVVILVVIVGALVWYFTAVPQNEAGFEVDVNLPSGSSDGDMMIE